MPTPAPSTVKPVCEMCGDIGRVRRAVPLGHPDYGRDFPCTCRADEMARRRTDKLWSSAGVPPKYADYTLNGYVKKVGNDPGKRAAIDSIKHYYEHGSAPAGDYNRTGILLYGDPGQGKTGALAPLFTHLIRSGHEGLWLQYNDFLDDMRDFDSGNVRPRMEQCKDIDYLFIDDFGDPEAGKAATDYARDVMFRIIDHRVNGNKPMFITTNLSPQQISQQFHGRTARRIAEVCVLVEVNGRSLTPTQPAQA